MHLLWLYISSSNLFFSGWWRCNTSPYCPYCIRDALSSLHSFWCHITNGVRLQPMQYFTVFEKSTKISSLNILFSRQKTRRIELKITSARFARNACFNETFLVDFLTLCIDALMIFVAQKMTTSWLFQLYIRRMQLHSGMRGLDICWLHVDTWDLLAFFGLSFPHNHLVPWFKDSGCRQRWRKSLLSFHLLLNYKGNTTFSY